MTTIRKIRIKGGIHDTTQYNQQKETVIENLVTDLATAIQRVTGQEAWIEVTFEKSIGTKINS